MRAIGARRKALYMSMNPAKRNRNNPLLKISGEEASYESSACSFSMMPSVAGSVISGVR